jgi:hypothetical protein
LTYSAVVTDPAVYFALFNRPVGDKKKTFSLTQAEFKDVVKEWVSASIRYGSLSLVSEKMNIKWNSEEQTFTVSGSYGI